MAEKSPKLKKEIDVPKLKKEINVQGQEANRIPNKMHSANRPIVRHIIKMSVLRGKFTAIQDFIRKQENFQKKHPNLPPKRMFKLPYSCIHVTY